MTLNETQVFMCVKSYLISDSWLVIGGQPPSGTDSLPIIEIRNPMYIGKGSKGSYKPDLIAWKKETLIIIELKPNFNQSDRKKVNEVLNSRERIDSLWDGINQRDIKLSEGGKLSAMRFNSRVVGGLGYSGNRVEHPELWRFFVKDGEVEVVPGTFSTVSN